ncbi:MAG: hypothetical protein ACLUYV_06280 [Alistipes shahii]
MTDNSLVSLTDLYATFADMLGYRIADDEAEDSFSFWPILDGSGNAARTDLIATSGAGYFTYRTPQYKLIFNAGNGSGEEYRIDGQPPLQFYDMVNDPEEKVNQINNPEYAGRIRGDGRPGEEVHRGRPIDARSQSGQRRRQFLETDHRHNERPVRREQVRAKLRRRMPEPPSGSDQKTSAFRNRNTEVFNWRQRAGAGHARRYRRAG